MTALLNWETSNVPDEEVEVREEIPAGTLASIEVTKTADGRPDPKWVRGKCPECGDDLVSNLYYIGGKGYLICWECWGSLQAEPTCSYRRIL